MEFRPECAGCLADLPPIDAEILRLDFPALHQEVRKKPLVYLDSAASTHKPQSVIDAVTQVYTRDYSNIHRGVHELSVRATRMFEAAREKVRCHLNAREVGEIIFTRGTTEAINLVAQSWGRANLKAGDEVLITWMEHHSNIVPWQMLRDQLGIVLKVAPVDDRGDVLMEEFEALLSPRTRLVSVAHISNALGTVNPVAEMIRLAHAQGAIVLVDGAQAVAHTRIDLQELDADFYVFAPHKIYGPTGIGVLYGRKELLAAMPPWQGGGDMILSVTFEKTTYNEPPYRFEAGTPNISGAAGLTAALCYVCNHGVEQIAAWENELLAYATGCLEEIPGLRIIGQAREKSCVLSFVLDGIHPHDIGTVLDMQGVAIRTGHHCAQPVIERFNVPATARASLAVYNTKDDVDALVKAVLKAQEILG
ncbi:MAG: cysteine desulfurase [Candidatus Cloacimonetes bacterium]|nr:cysteine desulfurase [Candidatus Cloacimonadota bacterium]